MHQTVLKQLAIDYLVLQPAPAWYVDATFGGGGHTREILDRGSRVIAFDFDQQAISRGEKDEFFATAIAAGRLILVRENFARLSQVISDLKDKRNLSGPILGVLFDFGTNSDQLLSAERGLSFAGDGCLDMRLDQRLGVTARDLLLALPEKELSRLFQELGGETYARPLARRIVQYRQTTGHTAFQSNQELVSLVLQVKRVPRGKIHPATKVFQALRMAVNDEVANLEQALIQSFALLEPGGRLVTIAFHEGEDRPVKQYFRELESSGQAQLLTKKPLSPDQDELALNYRARSAKMRALEKLKINLN